MTDPKKENDMQEIKQQDDEPCDCKRCTSGDSELTGRFQRATVDAATNYYIEQARKAGVKGVAEMDMAQVIRCLAFNVGLALANCPTEEKKMSLLAVAMREVCDAAEIDYRLTGNAMDDEERPARSRMN